VQFKNGKPKCSKLSFFSAYTRSCSSSSIGKRIFNAKIAAGEAGSVFQIDRLKSKTSHKDIEESAYRSIKQIGVK